MAIYDADGLELTSAYDADGDELDFAYDADGDVVYQRVEPEGLRLKVMQYNVGGWYNGTGQSVPSAYDQLYYDLQNGMISRNNPDILTLEEYRSEFTTGGRTAQSMLSQYFPYIHEENGTSEYLGRAICSKYPIVSYERKGFTDDVGKYYDTAQINVNGTTVTVIVTHFSTSGELRPNESAVLLAYAQTLDNVIIGGDFNLHCHSKTDTFPVTGMVEWESYEPWVEAGYHLANNDDRFGFIDTAYNPTYQWWYGLDNIIVSPDIYIYSVTTDRTKVTSPITSDPAWRIDHIPLIAVVYVPES